MKIAALNIDIFNVLPYKYTQFIIHVQMMTHTISLKGRSIPATGKADHSK